VFNLSSGVARPFAELAEAARRVAGLRIEDDAELVVDGGNDLPATVSNARVAAAVGWRPSRSPDDIVRELLASLDEREWAEGSVDTDTALS
jgi:nucleoside-diphosphate-sugar epimerase